MKKSTNVLLLGFGAIGAHVAQLLEPELQANTLKLTAAVRDPERYHNANIPIIELPSPGAAAELFTGYDLVLECAGVRAATDHGPAIIAAGTDLLLTSLGALAEPETFHQLLAGPGKLHVTHGAIGGFDVLGAAADADGIDGVTITTTKPPRSLIQPWMGETQRSELEQLSHGQDPVTVFHGKPASAIQQFPSNINVAVALAWAIKGRGSAAGTPTGPTKEAERMSAALEKVTVTLVADPAAELNNHRVTASGSAGHFQLDFSSAPSPHNPKTSGMTALAVAYSLRELMER